MNTAAATRPTTVQAQPAAALPVVQVRSASRKGLIYEVTPEHCPCEAFTFNHARDAAYRCKHQRSAFPAPKVAPAPRYCARPGCYDIARQAGVFCGSRCADLARNAAMDTFCADAAGELPDTSDEANAESARIRAEVLADLIAATPLYVDGRLVMANDPAALFA